MNFKCNLWPRCGCYKTLEHFQSALLAETNYDWEQLKWVAFTIAASLACCLHPQPRFGVSGLRPRADIQPVLGLRARRKPRP